MRAGQVISVDDLLAQVWGAEYTGEPQVVYVHIRWLREKIEADPQHPTRIITVRGVGYKWEPGPAPLPGSMAANPSDGQTRGSAPTYSGPRSKELDRAQAGADGG
jgi:DNA-binding winged helix-turn-helix (wHTH) protein